MPPKVMDQLAVVHPVLPDICRTSMAKAHVRIPDVAWNELIGAAIQRAVVLVRTDDGKSWSNKEAAAKVGVDDAEFGKWISGARRPQLDRLFAVPELQQPLVVALAELVRGIEIATVVTLKRSA